MDPIVSVGHDMIEIERIQFSIKRYGERFLEKVYTSEELRYCFQKRNPFPSLAVRFAAKEAIAKAFQCGIGKQLHWKSMSITCRDNGVPETQLDSLGKKLLNDFGGSKIILSLTHIRIIASAVALVV